MAQDNAKSADGVAMNVVWVQEDGRLTTTSIEKLSGNALQRLTEQGVFTRIKGKHGDKYYILVGEKDTERGFIVVNYDTVRGAPALFGGASHLIHPSRRKYAVTCATEGRKIWEIQDYDLERYVTGDGPWTQVSTRAPSCSRRDDGGINLGMPVVSNRYGILLEDHAAKKDLTAKPYRPRAGQTKQMEPVKKLGSQPMAVCSCASSECGHRLDDLDSGKFEAIVRQARVQRRRKGQARH